MGSNPTPSASEKPSHIKALRPYDWAFLFANLPLLHMIFGKKSCLPSDGLGFRQGQDVVHYVCGRKLGLIIQVAVAQLAKHRGHLRPATAQGQRPVQRLTHQIEAGGLTVLLGKVDRARGLLCREER